MSVLTRKLVAKELHVNRHFIVGAATASIVSAAISPLSKMAFNVGMLAWLTTVIAAGVMLSIYGVMNERKEQSLQFVMSLPISVAEYVRAKMLGLLLSFGVVWAVATASAVLLVLLAPDVPDGLLPYAVLLCMFLIVNFAVLLTGMLYVRSESASTALIVVTNMGVSIYMFTVVTLPGLHLHMHGPTPVWNSTFFTVLACELGVLFLALALPMATAARRRDFL
jgi:ABC-type transport system involved in multi-copper enzyme maturation permease subunit